ncbi:hypothetical protein [Leucobacter sp. USHLN153]|uniref:hypothetical protein n=1 Tax=Leucobacter sp. USHLN153 TaxID=3081268 RepID=UPI00301B47E8
MTGTSDTDFWITPGGLDQQAGGFEEWAAAVSDAADWISSNPIGSAADHPLYQGAADRAAEINAGLPPFLRHVRDVLNGVGAELREVATEARTIDMQTAAELDAVDPTEYNNFDPDAPGRRSAADIAPEYDRTDELLFTVNSMPGGGVGYYLASDGQYDYLNDRETQLIPGDVLSPSEWYWTVFGWVGAQNIKDQLVQAFGGRWIDLYEFKHTLKGLSDMLLDVSGNVEAAAGALSVYWQGYAANSAQSYFAELVEKLRDAANEIGEASDNFNSFLEGVEAEFDVLSGAAYAFMDAVIVAAVAAAAGTATAETGVGAVAGWGVAGLSLLYAANRAKKVWDGVQDLLTLLDILKAVEGLTADLGNVTQDLFVPAMEETA